MKQHFIAVLAVLCVIVLIIASAASIQRAKQLPAQPPQPESETEAPTEQESEPEDEEIGGMKYVEYTGEAHAGTGIAYRGSGENAQYVIVIDAGHQARGMSKPEPDGPGSNVMKEKVTGGTRGSLTGLTE